MTHNVESITEELFNEHALLITEDPILFRKRVIRYLKAQTGLDRPAAAQQFERTLKRLSKQKPEFVQPLLDARLLTQESKKVKLQPDNECYSVTEIVEGDLVGKCVSFLTQEEAKKHYDTKTQYWPNATWVLIKGLGPNSGDNFKLHSGEKEIMRHLAKSA